MYDALMKFIQLSPVPLLTGACQASALMQF